jgi:hypothetical protein
MVVNYQKGKIYMIESLIGNCRYYGSTTQTLAQRLGKHRQDITKSNITSKKVLQYDDYRILLVLNFPCNSKEELEAKEAEYIRNNDCVNKYIPQRTKKEYYEEHRDKFLEKNKQYRDDNKDKIKQYRDDNKDKIKQYYENNKDKIKQYRDDNKDKILEKNKQYYENNKDKIKQYRDDNKDKILEKNKQYYENNKDKKKQYYENNKDKKKQYYENNKEDIECDCGAIFKKQSLLRHCKTKKHQEFIKIYNFITS